MSARSRPTPVGSPAPSGTLSHVVTVSDRVAAGARQDESGPVLLGWLRGLGHQVSQEVVPDGEPVARAVRQAFADGAHLVLTTGGTGVGPRDLTPEHVAPLVVVEVPGLVELVRAAGIARGVPTAALTRGVAGIVESGGRRGVVLTLPGSPAACRDAVAALDPVLPHLLAQVAGGDH